MTDEEARAILRGEDGSLSWIEWDSEADKPSWNDYSGRIVLDGDFSIAELHAVLHFAPASGEAP